MQARLIPALTLLAVSSLLSGCEALKANENARAEVRQGGIIDTRIRESEARRGDLKKERDDLGDKKLNVDNELERMKRRIAAAQDEARKQDEQLAAAQADQRVSRQRIAELQERQRQLKAELAAADRQQKADQHRPPDPDKEKEKEAKLESLKKRQAVLQADLDAARSVRR